MDLLIHFENDFDLAPVCFGIVPVTIKGSGSAVRVLFLLSCFVSSGLFPLGGLFLFSLIKYGVCLYIDHYIKILKSDFYANLTTGLLGRIEEEVGRK